MRQHRINFFRILNLDELGFDYRLLKITNLNREIDEKRNISLYDTNVNRVAKNVAFELKQPAALVRKGEDHFLAIPFKAPNPELMQKVVPDIAYLEPIEGAHSLNLSKLNAETLPIAFSFLKFHLKNPLRNNPNLWIWKNNTFFAKSPINKKDQKRNIDIYEGFSFGIIADDDNNLFLCLDITYKYIDRYFLTEYLKNPGVSIKEHFYMKHCLYYFGHKWYPIQIFGVGKTIGEQEFVKCGKTYNIYSYTLNKCKMPLPTYIENLDPNSISIAYKYPNREMSHRYGAAALCRLMYSTNDPKIKSLHHFSQKRPQKRFDIFENKIRHYFSDIKLGQIPIKIDLHCLIKGI